MYNIPVYIGRKAISIWGGIRDFSGFVTLIIISLRSVKNLKIRVFYNSIINQIRFTGIDALFFLVIIALLIGATIITQAIANLPKFGVEGFLGNLLVVIVARELGPLVTALVVTGRSGSAIAAEISTQAWSKEIKAMEIMGIDTKLYLVLPRIVASIISFFSLLIIFNLVAFFGGYLIARTTVYIPVDGFVLSLIDALSFKDLISALTKSVCFGVAIPLICCYYGFKPESKFQIPIFVSKGVIRTFFTIILLNALISIMFYL